MSEKIEKIKAQLVSFEANFNKYKELYIQSGLSEDELVNKIDQCIIEDTINFLIVKSKRISLIKDVFFSRNMNNLQS